MVDMEDIAEEDILVDTDEEGTVDIVEVGILDSVVVVVEEDSLDMHDTVAADIVDMDAGEGSLENLADMEDTEV